MARFMFKLEPLLRARRAAEQQKQLAVAELERERRKLEDEIRRKQTMLSDGKQHLRQALLGRVDPDDLRLNAAASMRLSANAQRLVLALAGVHKRLEGARAELIEATKARRAIELIRDQRYEAWRAALNKAETNAIDELAVIAAGRRGRVDDWLEAES